MHCVSIYPTNIEQCQLNNIKMLKERYPGLTIGWSTHEDPDDSNIVSIAKAAGADIFERHIGVETKDIKLNKYSSTPEQVGKWIDSWINSKENFRKPNRDILEIERESLHELRRGVYMKKSLNKGHSLGINDVYFCAMSRKSNLFR